MKTSKDMSSKNKRRPVSSETAHTNYPEEARAPGERFFLESRKQAFPVPSNSDRFFIDSVVLPLNLAFPNGPTPVRSARATWLVDNKTRQIAAVTVRNPYDPRSHAAAEIALLRRLCRKKSK